MEQPIEIVIYSSYTEAKKRGIKKWRDANIDYVRLKDRERAAKRELTKIHTEETKAKRKETNRLYYLSKKLSKTHNEDILIIS
jgi:hypothetical protein